MTYKLNSNFGIPPCAIGRPVRLTDQYLAGADFGGTKYFSGVDLRNTKLWAAYLGWAKLDGTLFDGAAMDDSVAFGGTQMDWVRAKGDPSWTFLRYNYIVNFEHSNLRKASFKNTSVGGASFANVSDLFEADFTNTDLSRTDFTDAKN